MEMIERDAAWQTSGTPSIYELSKRKYTRPIIHLGSKFEPLFAIKVGHWRNTLTDQIF